MKTTNKAILYAGVAVLSWSTVATAFKLALRQQTHFEMLLVASCTAFVILAATMTIQAKWGQLTRLSGKQWGVYALIGLLNPALYYLVLFKAYALLPAQIAQPINYAWPILLLLLIAAFGHQPIRHKKYIGMALSLGGVVLISVGSGQVQQSAIPVTGLLLALLSALLWATFWLINKMNEKTDSTVNLFVIFLFGSGYLLFSTLLIPVHLSFGSSMYASIYIGAFEMAIPFIFFSMALKSTNNPAFINQLCYLAPFISLLLIHFVLKEHIYTTTFFGLILIIVGIVFNEYFASAAKTK
ncbi:MAG: family transporter [Bacteroidetes bacterium]|nr:family transporter [Bacteroidota bacterium]